MVSHRLLSKFIGKMLDSRAAAAVRSYTVQYRIAEPGVKYQFINSLSRSSIMLEYTSSIDPEPSMILKISGSSAAIST